MVLVAVFCGTIGWCCYPADLRTRCNPAVLGDCAPGESWLYPSDAGVDAIGVDGLGLPPLPAMPPRQITWCVR
jgi:hypothetical protein